MKRTTWYVILAVALIGAIAGVFLWQSRSSTQSKGELRVATVERGSMLVTISSSGKVKPQERVDLTFETNGTVAAVPVEVGDEVEAGDVLAQMDTDRLKLQVEQAKAALASAEAQLARLRAGPRPEEVAAAEANLGAAEAQVSAAAAEQDQIEAGASDAQVAAAEANLAAALTEQKKAEDLHDTTIKCVDIELPAGKVIELPGGDVITITENLERTVCPLLGVPEEQARYRLEAANQALEAAQSQLDETLSGADEDQLRAVRANVWATAAQRDATQAQLDLLTEGASDAQIAVVEAQVAQARAAVEQAELALDRATLTAPFDGVVAAVNVTMGERATAGLPAVTLIDATQFHVTASVDEMDIGQLTEGQTARVTLEAIPDTTVTGTVERIAPSATLDGGVVTYDVTIGLAPTDVPIRADMTANVTISVRELSNVLKIPTWLVRVDRDTGQTYVQRRVDDKIERVDVELGVRDEGIVQVLDGLSEGDEVVRSETTEFEFEHP